MTRVVHFVQSLKSCFLDYYDLVSVSKIIVVASHSNTQVAVTFTINIEQVYRCNDDFKFL